MTLVAVDGELNGAVNCDTSRLEDEAKIAGKEVRTYAEPARREKIREGEYE